MYNPRKRVPATVEFTDIIAPARGGAQALVDVAGYKNADALVHVVHAFRDQSVPHPSGSIDPARDAQAMEDELILADLGVAERRLERLEKDLKKGRSAELEKERDLVRPMPACARGGKAAACARTHRRGSETTPWLSVSLGEATVARHQSRRSGLERCRIDGGKGRRQERIDRVSGARSDQSGRAVRKDRARDLAARGKMPRRFCPISG